MGKILEYFQKFKDRYNDFRPIISDIKVFEYTDGEKYNILPCYFERGFLSKGKNVASKDAIYTYGFNSNSKLIYVKFGNNQESFLQYFDDSINLYCFEDDNDNKDNKTLRYIQITELNENGLPYGTIEVDKHNNVYVEKYHYDNSNKIKRIENPIHFEFETYNDALDIEYDSNGEVMLITDKETWLANGVVYKKILPEEAENLRTTIISKISQNVINGVINKYKEKKDKVCYISLEIHEEPHTVLSVMYSRVAFESERNKYVLENGPEFERFICYYSNNPIGIYDKQLEMECNILVQYYIRYSDCYTQCREIVKSIRNTLKGYDWEKHIEISDKFDILEPLTYD